MKINNVLSAASLVEAHVRVTSATVRTGLATSIKKPARAGFYFLII